jgi:regulation of enolase protein 1 (concanavalin A-like superfamily)
MAVSTTCPSCGRKVPLPDDFKGGMVSCPNADCAQTFQTQATAPRLASGAAKARAKKGPGSRPELLDRLPTSFWISPPMYLIGGVFVMLYGLVFAGIASSWKNRPVLESMASNDQVPARVPIESINAVSNPGGSTPDKPEPKPDSKQPKPNVDAANKSDTPKAAAPEPPKSERKTEKAKEKTEVARVTPKKPEEKPKPPPAPQAVTWADLKGDRGDTEMISQGVELLVTVPGSLHILSSLLETKNAPRLLTSVTGDFTATVKVSGRILPGTDPLPKLPFTFQGAGLIVWENDGHYLRLERAGSYSAEGKKHMVMEEYVKDDKTAPNGMRDTRQADLLLRIERHGSEMRCLYSPDEGKTWLEVKRQSTAFPAEVQVGVSFANASPKPFAIMLENFQLTTGKAGK